MKYLILLLSLSAFANLESPRETMKTFLKSMVQVKEGKNIEFNYTQAFKTIDPNTNSSLTRFQKKIANELIDTFDKLEKIDYEDVPDEINDKKWVYDKRNFSALPVEIALIKNDKNQWLFSDSTIKSLDLYKENLKDEDYVKDVVHLKRLSHRIKNALPVFFSKSFLFLELWQWLVLLSYIIAAFIVEKLANILFRALINGKFKFFKSHDKKLLETIIFPLGKLFFFGLLLFGIGHMDLNIKTYNFISETLYVLSIIAFIWLGKRIIEIFAIHFKEKSLTSDSKFDDIMVPLLAKTSYVFLYLIGLLLIAYSIDIDVTGIIAGLGIGGLAFAFAAKDTLANFFGSIMLVLDRPFDIGDVIVAGDLEGVVEEVGFRSTRIRTFYDSVITISNGELVNRPIDNKGKRRYRRLTTTLGVEYDTPPKKVEAFCEGIRQLIINHKWTRKDYFNVYFTNFGASSLDISILVFWQTDDYTREQAEKHRLMIDILRLANDMEINFAFPTQTVHLFRGKKQEDYSTSDLNFEEGIEFANKVVSKPFSLKNPRSNYSEKDQFGDNDFGL